MSTSLEAARTKLAGNPASGVLPFPFDDLPIRDDSTLWDRIETTYGLSLAELSALKNARCWQPPAGKYWFPIMYDEQLN